MPVSTTASAPGRRQSHGTEQHIDGRTAVVFRRSLSQAQGCRRADTRTGLYLHMPVAFGDVDGSRTHRLAFDGLVRRKPAAAVEPLGK